MQSLSKRVLYASLAVVFCIGVGGFAPQLAQPVKAVLPDGIRSDDRVMPVPFASEPGSASQETTSAQLQPAESGKDRLVRMPAADVAAADIRVAPVEKGQLTRTLAVPGTVTPNNDRVARAPAKVAGTVARLYKRLGDSVAEGEVVAVLSSREVADAKSEYLTASVDYDLQKTMFERIEALWNRKVASEQQYLNSRATFRQAQLRLNLARQKLGALGLEADDVAAAALRDGDGPGALNLREYEVRAPISGRIVERKVDPGTAMGQQGEPSELYTIADLSSVWIELAVPLADLDQVEVGQTVLIRDADQRKSGTGRIIFLGPILNEETHSARIIAEIDNRAAGWKPGSIVAAEIVVDEREAELHVPRTALQTIDGRRVVFVRTDQGFSPRQVEVGRSNEKAVEVTSGLAPGDQIAVSNTFLLKAELAKAESAQAN